MPVSLLSFVAGERRGGDRKSHQIVCTWLTWHKLICIRSVLKACLKVYQIKRSPILLCTRIACILFEACHRIQRQRGGHCSANTTTFEPCLPDFTAAIATQILHVLILNLLSAILGNCYFRLELHKPCTQPLYRQYSAFSRRACYINTIWERSKYLLLYCSTIPKEGTFLPLIYLSEMYGKQKLALVVNCALCFCIRSMELNSSYPVMIVIMIPAIPALHYCVLQAMYQEEDLPCAEKVYSLLHACVLKI